MNSHSPSPVGTPFRLLALCALATFLGACAATSVKNSAKSPDFRGPVGKIAVLTIDQRGWVREGFDNRFVRELTKAGASAASTHDVLTPSQIKEDKRAAADRLTALGARAVLIVRLVDKTSSYKEIRPAGERWAPVVGGIDSFGWYDYYNVAYMDMSPTYGTLKEMVYLETALYDLASEKRLWLAVTETVVKDTTDRLAEVDRLVGKIVGAMTRDGVVP